MNAQMWRRTKNPLLWPDFIFRWTEDYKICTEYVAKIHEYMWDLIVKRRAELKQGRRRASIGGRPTDFLQHLIDAADANPESQPDSQLLSNVTGLIFAAFDTSCIAMGWILYAMAKYPEWQDKCRAEVEAVIGDSEDPTYDSLAELKNVTMFVKECLRMWPPVPILGRINPEPFEAGGFTVPSQTWVEVGVWGVHHNKDVWPDPETFNPERFSETAKIQNYSFLPFSAGPRGCLGRNFAMNELKTMTSMLLQNFTFTPDETLPEPKLIAEIMLLTTDGLRVKVSER